MKKLLLIALLFVGCKTKQENLEAKVKAFMAKEYVPSMNDPKSYEYVSMEIDTIKGRAADLRAEIKALDESPESYDKKLAEINSHPSNKDSTYYYIINAKIRGKNKMGGLILSEQKIKFTSPEGFVMLAK